jgi:hypothetical protein
MRDSPDLAIEPARPWPLSKAAHCHYRLNVGTDAHPAIVTAALFGESYGNDQNLDWTFRNFEVLHAEGKNLPHAQRLADIMAALGTKRLYAPSPMRFNGAICEPHALRPLRLLAAAPRHIYRGADADGCPIGPEEAVGWSLGGCAIFLGSLYGDVVAAHAGRDCFFDRSCFDPRAVRAKGRTHESVVESIAYALTDDPWRDARDLRFHIFYPLRPQTLSHPLIGEFSTVNNAMHDYLRKRWGEGLGPQSGVWKQQGQVVIDTYLLARAQCTQDLGMSPQHVRFHPLHADLIPGVYHTRQKEPFRSRRNFAIVARHPA